MVCAVVVERVTCCWGVSRVVWGGIEASDQRGSVAVNATLEGGYELSSASLGRRVVCSDLLNDCSHLSGSILGPGYRCLQFQVLLHNASLLAKTSVRSLR